MKRIVIGTWYECNKVIERNNELGDAGYDYYTVTEVTDVSEIEHLLYTPRLGTNTQYNGERRLDRLKDFAGAGNLFLLEMFCDNDSRKYDNAMKVL